MDVISSRLVIMNRSGVRWGKTEGELLWLLKTLWEDVKTLFFARLPMIVDELERMLNAEPMAKDRVSPYIAKVVGDLSIIPHYLRQLEIYRP